MGIHREEKQMYGLAHCAVHHNFWTIVPLELILPHDFRQRGKNLGEETSRQPLQSFLRTSLSLLLEDISFPKAHLLFCLQWILEDVWYRSDSLCLGYV